MQLDPIKEAEAVQRLKASLGTLAEDDPELLHDAAEGETSLFEAIDQILAGMDEDEILIAGIKARMDELADRRRRLEKRVGYRRSVIEQAMAVADLPSIQRPGCTVTLSARAPQLVIADEAEIPARFFKSEPKLDKAAVKAALKDGETVPGASMDNAPPSLTIRKR